MWSARLLALAVLAVALTVCQGQVSDLRAEICANPSVDATTLLNGLHLRVGLYSGELVQCTGTDAQCATGRMTTQAQNTDLSIPIPMWQGWDAALLEHLANLGNFTYDIVSMGRSTDISQLPGGYTRLSRQMLGVDPVNEPLPTGMGEPVDLFGQGTWRVTAGRGSWALWSDEVVSEEVVFLTKIGVVKEKSLRDRALLIFGPFAAEVWTALAAAAVVMVGIVLGTSKRKFTDGENMSSEDMAFTTVMTGCGHAELGTIMRARVKGLMLAWIFFCVLMLEFYLANLTAILAQPNEVGAQLDGIKDLRSQGLPLCVQRGAANDGYFTWHHDFGDQGRGIDIQRMGSTTLQMDGVASGECPASEITREDFSLWVQNHPVGACAIGVVGVPLTRRARGMMTWTNRSCVMVAMNSLIHRFGTRNCSRIPIAQRPKVCDLHDLTEEFFPAPNCDDDSSETDVEALTLKETGAIFIILIGLTTLALGHQMYDGHVERKNRRKKIARDSVKTWQEATIASTNTVASPDVARRDSSGAFGFPSEGPHGQMLQASPGGTTVWMPVAAQPTRSSASSRSPNGRVSNVMAI